jgi:hypothetical protein
LEGAWKSVAPIPVNSGAEERGYDGYVFKELKALVWEKPYKVILM